MVEIAIVGAGGFGREVKIILNEINKINPTYTFLGYYDDGYRRGSIINDYPVLGCIDDLNKIETNLAIAVAIGNPLTKQKVINKIKNPLIFFPNIVSPQAIISDEYVKMGLGNIICAGTILTCNIFIENFVIFNLMCTVGHDTRIGSFCSCMPSVNISGEVTLHQGVYVGTGAKIINQIEIGEFSTIGAGAVVAKNLPAKCTAVGIPAKPIKFH